MFRFYFNPKITQVYFVLPFYRYTQSPNIEFTYITHLANNMLFQIQTVQNEMAENLTGEEESPKEVWFIR